jgi:hypothetical protein
MSRATNVPTCQSCDWWRSLDGRLGQCRRFPPRGGGDPLAPDAMPRVYFWFGCAEHSHLMAVRRGELASRIAEVLARAPGADGDGGAA